jgi:hypothetical protein
MRIKVLCALAVAALLGACTTTAPTGGASAAFVAAPKAKAPVSREAIEEELLRSVALSL